MRKSIILLTWIFLNSLAAMVRADQITLSSEASVSRKGSALEIVIKVANSGDKTATKVTPRARLQSQEFLFSPIDIEPGKETVFRTKQDPFELFDKLRDGVYPVPIEISYFSEGLPVTSASFGVLKTKNFETPELLKLEVEMSKQVANTGSILITNLTKRDLEFDLDVHNSKLVNVALAKSKMSLAGGERVSTPFTVNAESSAFAAVSTPLIFFVSYELAGRHLLQVMQISYSYERGTTGEQTADRFKYLSLIIIAAALLATLIALRFRKS